MNTINSHDRSPVICRLLRAKNGYGTMEGGENGWLLVDSSTSVYWCLCTMLAYGPDENLAHSDLCREGRSCFTRSRQTVEEAD